MLLGGEASCPVVFPEVADGALACDFVFVGMLAEDDGVGRLVVEGDVGGFVAVRRELGEVRFHAFGGFRVVDAEEVEAKWEADDDGALDCGCG